VKAREAADSSDTPEEDIVGGRVCVQKLRHYEKGSL